MTVRTMLVRALRLRCPCCGRGSLFRDYFVRADDCDACGWKFERGEGHWVGGSEVHMFVSYFASVFVCIPLLVALGRTPLVMAGVILGHIGLSLVLFRLSRSVFLAVDYFVDPGDAPPGDDDDDGGPPLIRPRTPGGLGRRRARRRELASGRAKEPVRT